MKKLILLILLAIIMAGCNSKNEDGSFKLDSFDGPHVVVIDSCEYISWGQGIAHKGNCKYCEERRKKEQEKLIRKIKEQ